jgi:peptide/nickel transport system ATP-binding protein
VSDATEAPPADVDADRRTAVEVRDLQTYYVDDSLFGEPPVRAVDGVSFDVAEGETFGIVGESGCGKTTLGRTLLGLEEPTGGVARVAGQDVTNLSGADRREWQRDAQMVFQDPHESLNDRMTVGEIVREPMDAHDWGTADERRRRALEFIERVGLNEEHYYRYPTQFSGGQRQRIAIARALVLEPEFVVLDEPTSALDVSVQARIINLLEDLQDELGLTYLFITHDLSVVRHICDRVAVMYLGHIVEQAPTEDLFTDPAHPYTVSLLSAIPGDRTAGPAAGRERISLRGTPPNPRDPPAGCPFSTRCPAKVRPDEYDLSADAWAAIEEFRAVLRARSRADVAMTDRIRMVAGVDVATAEVEEIVDTLFEGVDLPAEVGATIETAVGHASAGRDREAAEHLLDTFQSACDETFPEDRDLGDGRRSRCVRHDAEYEDVDTVVERRHGD